MRMALMLQDRLGLGSNGKPLVKIDKSYMQKILPLRMPMVMQYLSKKQLRQLRDERREKAEERKQAAKAKAALPMTRLLSTWSVQRTRSRSTMDAAPEREAARIRRIDKLFEAFAQVRDYLADAPIEVQEKAVAEARTYPRIEVYSDKCKPQEPIPLLVHAGLEEIPKDLTTVRESVFANIPFEKRPKELTIAENGGKTRKGKPKKRK